MNRAGQGRTATTPARGAAFAVQLATAIRERRVVEIGYGPGIRLVEPHLFGANARGDPLLLAFQRAGASASRAHAGWKSFRLDRVRFLRVTRGRFAGARPGYGHGRDPVPTVFARL